MKLSAVRVFVRDIEEAEAFYSMLGLSVESYMPEQGVCVFNTGETLFIVESVAQGAPKDEQLLVGRFTGVSFPTDDIQAQVKDLQSKGVSFSGLPEQQGWGGWLATFVDPSGNQLQLVQEPT